MMFQKKANMKFQLFRTIVIIFLTQNTLTTGKIKLKFGFV